MIERVVHDGLELALILRSSHRGNGIEFFTSDQSTIQLGYMSRPKNYVIQPHLHRPVAREVQYTEEVLFIRSGRVRVDFYDEARSYLESVTLGPGDVVLLKRGGHGFEMLEPCEMVEVKQGPYVGDQDKDRFAPATAPSLRCREVSQ